MLKLVTLLLLLLSLGYLYFNFMQSKDLRNQNIKKLSSTKVDVTEDYRALGYTGQKKLITDNEGNIYLAYRKKVNGQYEVFIAKLKAGEKGFIISGIKDSVSNVGTGAPQRVPSIAVDKDNNLYVVWYGADSSKNEGNRQIKFSRSEDQGASWRRWINISPVQGYAGENLWQEHPDILASKDGNVYVVWEGKDRGNRNQQIKFSKSSDKGDTWDTWININPSRLAMSRPTILEAKDMLYVFAYGKIDSPTSQIYLTTSSDQGETWREWENLSNSLPDARHVSAISDGKNILTVWREGSEEENSQLFYSYFDGKSWTGPKIVSKSNKYQLFPQLGLGGNNESSLVWIETDESSDFPNDDPKEGIVKSAVFNSSSKSFVNIKELAKDAFYPVTSSNFASYLLANDEYELVLNPL